MTRVPCPRRFLAVLAPVALSLVGCYQVGDAANSPDPRFVEPSTSPLEARLEPAESCPDLLTRLRADALEKLNIDAWSYAEAYVEPDYPIYGGGGWVGADSGIAVFPSPPVADPTTGTPTAGAPTGALDSAGAPRHTETNTQIAGVDEADFVETDGTHVYLLHGDELFVLDAVPLGTVTEGGRARIEGSPIAMFVDAGRAVVISSIYPRYWGYPGPYYPGGPAVDPAWPTAADGGVATGFDAGSPDPVDAGSPDPSWWNGGTTTETKLTVLDVTSGAPAVVAEHYYEGNYVDARRHGDVVRVVVQSYDGGISATYPPSGWDPNTGRPLTREQYLVALAAWRDAERARIESASLDAFLPSDATVSGGVRVDVGPDCSGYYLPPPAQANTGMARIVGLSMTNPSNTKVIGITGRADVVYANHDVLELAQRDYRWAEFTGVAQEETALHSFTLAGLGVRYEGSGKVSGIVSDQFSIDEHEGVVRVVSTEDRPQTDPTLDPRVAWIPSTPVTHVVTLTRTGSSLAPLGRTPDIAPGERVQAVRFLGEKVYVVTFLQVDPLFVVDLSNPAQPTVLGELTIPGFSEYIHELDATHLLTIGRETGGFGAGGVALQIFDVADATHPTLVHKLVLPDASSDAEWDHKAFVFDSVTGLLAIPMSSYGTTFESSLRLFHVDVATGFAAAGAVHHEAYFDGCFDAITGAYYCGYSAQMRRGLFLGSYVYAISNRAVTASTIANPAGITGAYDLPEPVYYWAYGVAF